MKYTKSLLTNGLPLISVPLPSLESATLTVWVAVGSRFEHKKHQGLSHFLEHMAFKGGKKYPSAEKVSETLDYLGAEYNAGTSREWTNFYIKVRADLMDKAYSVLSDMLLTPLLKKKDIEKERGVILEEIAMQEDNPTDKIGTVFTDLIFGDTALGRDIAGKPKTVKSIKKDDFLRYRKSHYVAENMLLTVSGGIKDDQIKNLSEKHFSGLSKGKREKAEDYRVTQKEPQVKLEKKDVEQAHFILGFVGYPRNHEDRYAESMLATVLGRGMSSRLFREIREKRGLAYAVSTSVSHYVDTGLFATYAGVNLSKVDEAIKVMLDEYYGITNGKKKVTDAELKKAKEYVKGRMALALEDTSSVNSFFGVRALFLEEILTPDEVFEKIDAVTLDDVRRVAKHVLVPEKLNLAVLGPYRDSERFEKLIV